MAKIRIGFSTQFEVENEKVGIGTDSALDTLHVTGDIIAHNIDAGKGITTVTTYGGFIDKEVKLTNQDINLNSQSHSLSGEIIIDNEVTVSSGTTFTSGPENLTVTDNFTLPGISDDKPTVGSTRFNENLGALEFYTGVEWRAVNSRVDMSGGGSRGIFAGGYFPSNALKNIEYINIATQGNSHRFGDLVDGQGLMDGASSSTRMVVSGGYNSGFGGGAVHDIQYITMASEGNATDFGDQTQVTYGTGACSSSTRALIMGGNRTPDVSPWNDGNDGNNTICYIEIATIGNALDFGDLSQRRGYPASCGDSVRAVIMGQYANEIGVGGITNSDTVLYASKGNGVDFGNAAEGGPAKAASNSTRGIFAGSNGGSQTFTNIMQYVSIQTLGNAVDFGTRTYDYNGGCMSSQTRLVSAGGRGSGSPGTGSKTIDYVEFASLGDAMDFGDAGYLAADNAGSSDSHGGLGGF